jgi:hypothetical protein
MKTIDELKTDYDWKEAFVYFPAAIDDLKTIIAADDGCNEEADWVILARLKDGRYLAGRAGCDYTGWDCQAGGSGTLHATLEEAVRMGLTPEEQTRLNTGSL